MSMKNSSYTIGNRIHDLPSCNAVPQPTAPSLTPPLTMLCLNLTSHHKLAKETVASDEHQIRILNLVLLYSAQPSGTLTDVRLTFSSG
jgi:hypothetical protein